MVWMTEASSSMHQRPRGSYRRHTHGCLLGPAFDVDEVTVVAAGVMMQRGGEGASPRKAPS